MRNVVFKIKTIFFLSYGNVFTFLMTNRSLITLDLRGESVDRSTSSVWTTPPTRSYARISEVLELPNLIEIQTASYQWFLDEGLREMFQDISPIEDFTGNLSLEFIDYSLG